MIVPLTSKVGVVSLPLAQPRTLAAAAHTHFA